MSERLEVRAEVLKLARLLDQPPGELAYLEQVAAAELCALREQVTEVLFNAHESGLRRLAAASRLLPVALVAQLAERPFGPVLSARIAGLIDPDRAVDLAERLPIPFLADIAAELDPRRSSDVLARIPPDRIAAISRELARRGEHVTMGRFVGYLPTASVQAAVGEMDAATALEVAFVLENKERLPELIALIGTEPLREMVALAAESEYAEEAAELLDHMTPAQRAVVMQMPAVQQRRIA